MTGYVVVDATGNPVPATTGAITIYHTDTDAAMVAATWPPDRRSKTPRPLAFRAVILHPTMHHDADRQLDNAPRSAST